MSVDTSRFAGGVPACLSGRRQSISRNLRRVSEFIGPVTVVYGWYADPWEREESENVELSGGVEDWWGWKWYRHKAKFHRATQYQASLTGRT
jgi:hypothetical protein